MGHIVYYMYMFCTTYYPLLDAIHSVDYENDSVLCERECR